jgi:methylated-DNA-[protein]-cysteine S-methyltransferase
VVALTPSETAHAQGKSPHRLGPIYKTRAVTRTRAPLLTVLIPTPAGPLSVLADESIDDANGPVIVAAGYTTDAEELHVRLSADSRARPLLRTDDLHAIQDALWRYHAGEPAALDDLPIEQPGTPYQQAVWQALRAIPPGSTLTYTQLASAAGKPQAVRATGAACGRNLIAPIVPCHRALRRDGGLGGYYYGLDVKRWLLDLEASAEPNAQSST